jgi:putative pyruvate formate lyase activating enzyme
MICNACPRRCGAERSEYTAGGVCASPYLPRVARAALHYGEEPCISGSRGSGTVFFSGCNLRCVFCQNHEISRAQTGKTVTVERLAEIFRELQDKGAHNINLVTPTHYTDAIVRALEMAKPSIPVAWNSSGYDSVESLRKLEGLVQIYMPDLKYMDASLAKRYSAAPDYPETAQAAIREMFRQTGNFVLDDNDMLSSGVLIRHLILPEAEENSRAVIDFVADSFPEDSVMFSLMAQYTPMPNTERFPELQKTVTAELNDRLVDYMISRGISNGFWQEPSAATDDMIPEFDLTGV